MIVKELMSHLKSYPEDMQVYVTSDEEFNTLFSNIDITSTELNKLNNDGTYDAVVIYGLSGNEIE